MRFAVFSWAAVGFFNPFLSLFPGINTYRTVENIKCNLAFVCRMLCRNGIAFLALSFQTFYQTVISVPRHALPVGVIASSLLP